MAATTEGESQQNFILAFVLGLIALVIFFVIGIVLYQKHHAAGASAQAAAQPQAPATTLAVVIKGVEAGHRAVISGFHDATGDAALNEQLAKKRAETVRDVLTGLGVPTDKVELEKPAVTTGSGDNAAARRVEVRLID